MKKHIDKVRDILNDYKIFMEFFSMICLSLMSIFVGVAANRITKEQLLLTEKQLKAEFSPRFELIENKNDSKIRMWIRNYGNIPINSEDPLSSFSNALLTDYNFIQTYSDYSDWNIVTDYIDGNIDNIDNAINIKRDFNNLINGYSNFRRFENMGKQISDVCVQPFVLCELYTRYEPTPISYFTITDFFAGYLPKYYNSMFALEYRTDEILYDAVSIFNRNIYKRNPDIGYNVQFEMLVKITYRDSLDNLIIEFYQLGEDGNELIKTGKNIDSFTYIAPLINPQPMSDDIRVFTSSGFTISDLYDEDSRIFDAILKWSNGF